MAVELLIYSPVLNPRINYTFSLFFESLISSPYKLTSDVSEYKNYNGPKLNYSGQVIEQNEIFIHASGLLSETGIHAQQITVTEWEGLKIFFQTSSGSLPFDVFAASFYLVSRYEEYLPFTADKHGRYSHTESLAFKNKFLDEPLVNYWAEKLKTILSKRYADITFKENAYTFVPTVDVDIAFAHKGRGVFLTIASYLKALSKFDIPLVFRKTMTLLGIRVDEYDTFVYMHDVFRANNVSPIYFVLAGKRGTFDKNIPVSGSAFKELVKELSFRGSMGIHPSYDSGNDKLIVKQEIEAVEKPTRGRLTKSRQHFLKMTLPDTYECLAALKITDDYTMLYPSINGFRASICSPFYFYDLKAEVELPVKVHPGVLMDGTLKDYEKLSPAEANKIIRELIMKVKKCRGEFIPVLHNHNLSEQGEWKGWREVFEKMVAVAV
jgi:hypothetical protein